MDKKPELPETWSGLEDSFAAEAEIELQQKEVQDQVDQIDKMMYDLVTKNKKTMDYLFTKFVIDSTVAAPGMDQLQIGINQGKVELMRWIFTRAEANRAK